MSCFPTEQNFAISIGMNDADLMSATKARLLRHKGRYKEFAEAYPAVGHSWLTKFAQGQIVNPTVSSLQALIDALDDFEGVQSPARLSPETP